MSQSRPAKSVLITDLDDTLYDWLRYWYYPFQLLVVHLCNDAGVPLERLLDEFRSLHQRHGTSECSFLISELPSLQSRHPQGDIAGIYDEALHAYYSERRKRLRLFPGVREAIQAMRDAGTLIIAFTESLGFYAGERLRFLELDGLIDRLYSPPDHALPDGFERYYSNEHYELVHASPHVLRHSVVKPNPEILADILSDIGAEPDQALYVGDKLMKDVPMAQEAGVSDVYAAYGEGHGREGYELLRWVSHWTPADIEREKKLQSAGEVQPTFVLRQSFVELLDLFSFTRFSP